MLGTEDREGDKPRILRKYVMVETGVITTRPQHKVVSSANSMHLCRERPGSHPQMWSVRGEWEEPSKDEGASCHSDGGKETGDKEHA